MAQGIDARGAVFTIALASASGRMSKLRVDRHRCAAFYAAEAREQRRLLHRAVRLRTET